MKKGTVSMKILLLEDDPILSDILLCHLNKHMHQTTHCDNGQLASDALNDQKFDLLILDITSQRISHHNYSHSSIR
jgi:DNA-binding response OmpR family regulator